jgi:hypothetical protein
MLKFLETIEPILPISFSQRTIYRMGPQHITKSWSVENEQSSSNHVLYTLSTGMLIDQTNILDQHSLNFQMDFSQQLVDFDSGLDSLGNFSRIWIDGQTYWAKLFQDSPTNCWTLEIPEVVLGVTGGQISGTATLRGENLTAANQFSKVSLDSYSIGWS